MKKHRHTVTINGQGYTVTGCFGADACPHRSLDAPDLPQAVASALEAMGIGQTLLNRLGHPIRAHNVLKISISYCPNACARSQIADVGLIGAARPAVDTIPCIACGACAEACREEAITFDGQGIITAIDPQRCVSCGACAKACPVEAITEAEQGFRLMLGGKLGRHPRFAEELPGLFATQELPALVARAVGFYLQAFQGHERLGDVVTRLGAAAFFAPLAAQGKA